MIANDSPAFVLRAMKFRGRCARSSTVMDMMSEMVGLAEKEIISGAAKSMAWSGAGASKLMRMIACRVRSIDTFLGQFGATKVVGCLRRHQAILLAKRRRPWSLLAMAGRHVAVLGWPEFALSNRWN